MKKMKNVIHVLICSIVMVLAANSCKTGYSKQSYISALEKFVARVESNYANYDEQDWKKADERMEAFVEKFDNYEEKLATEEKRQITKLMVKYKTIRSKAKVEGFFKDIDNVIDEGIGTLEGILEGVVDPSSSEGKYE